MLMQHEAELNKLFGELVPASGKADSLAGEMVRATERIAYRYFNDGDHLGVGYGKETCNAPARFLMDIGNERITNAVVDLWGMISDEAYEIALDTLAEAVIAYIEHDPQSRTDGTVDMWDYFDADKDRDDSWDDEDEDDYEEEWEDEDADDEDW